ncbi:MAG TPA: type IV pilus biogenesis/stability protein PilW [Burkholderiales bacterium]|nr:type IV pilus biogenesis/stability protein PilW [Burkholderiales bacterium]
MKSARLAGLAAALAALAGCAAVPDAGPALKPAVQTTGEESNERLRARIHTELAAGYFELGNLGVALEEVNEALRADANYGPAYNVAGLVYAQLREDRLAEESFQRALRINPLDHDANNNYGSYLCQRKREEEAIKYFLAAVRNPLYKTPERSYVNAGMCARRLGDLPRALEFFALALKVRPDQPQALYHMADLAYARGDYGEAKSYLDRLVRAGPETAEALWLGVRIERRLGDRDTEASYAQRLRRNFPGSREAQALNAGRIE